MLEEWGDRDGDDWNRGMYAELRWLVRILRPVMFGI